MTKLYALIVVLAVIVTVKSQQMLFECRRNWNKLDAVCSPTMTDKVPNK